MIRNSFVATLNCTIKGRRRKAQSNLTLIKSLLRPSNRAFARHVAKDCLRYVFNSVCPVQGEARERAAAAATWLLRAQQATPDDGVSYGYFPLHEYQTNGWRRSYPETTGYIVPSLLEFAERFGVAEIREKALRMAIWEIEIQMPSGAVQGGIVCERIRQKPAAFNTGMVLHGFTAAYRATKALEFLEAGRRAADFLVSDVRDDGHFQTHGAFVEPHKYKTYCCLCAWALYRFGEDTGEPRYQHTAINVVEAALRQQQENGWFANNSLINSDAAITHTIAYALQGILEVGILAAREDFVMAAKKGTDPVVERVSPGGFLRGSFFADWSTHEYSSCLTGNAQLAGICYRLYEFTKIAGYKDVADRLVNYLKALQILDSNNPAINGAIPGSFPLIGRYMTLGYPNWATKYFLDALLGQDRCHQNSALVQFTGDTRDRTLKWSKYNTTR